MARSKASKVSAKTPKYTPTESERKALEKVASRKSDPLPKVTTRENALYVDHPDWETAIQLVCNALGTSDRTFALGILHQLKALSEDGDGNVTDSTLNFFLSFIRGVEPTDHLEATLAAQMIVIHQTMMELRWHLPKTDHPQLRNDLLSEINKLSRTFVVQMDALKRYRSKGEQKVTVQHVTVSEGGQAIVGDIHQAKPDASAQSVRTPPALTHSKETPMAPIEGAARHPTLARGKSKR